MAGASLVAAMAGLTSRLAADPRLADVVIGRPHPLLLVIRRERLFVVVAPTAVWERGRDLLRPFGAEMAEGAAALVLLGRPPEPDLAQALNHGLSALLPEAPGADEILVAVQGALDLLE